MCSFLGALGVKMILEGLTPLKDASLNKFVVASAGYSNSQRIEFGTRFKMFIQTVKVFGSSL
jgi:hypothetical protein